jgi:hypothetical protein
MIVTCGMLALWSNGCAGISNKYESPLNYDHASSTSAFYQSQQCNVIVVFFFKVVIIVRIEFIEIRRVVARRAVVVRHRWHRCRHRRDRVVGTASQFVVSSFSVHNNNNNKKKNDLRNNQKATLVTQCGTYFEDAELTTKRKPK